MIEGRSFRLLAEEDHTPATSTDNIAYAIIKTATALLGDDDITKLDINTHVVSNSDNMKEQQQILWEDFCSYKKIKYDDNIMSHIKEHDEKIIRVGGEKLALTMPTLPPKSGNTMILNVVIYGM